MMHIEASFASFLVVAAVMIVTPGPDTALTIRNILIGGRSSGLATAAGVAMGQAVWAMAASAGVVSILIASERLFHAMRIAGALYLVVLGARSLWRAARARSTLTSAEVAGSPRLLSTMSALRQGFLSNLANPKMAVFFASILPQFAPLEGGTLSGLMLLGAVFCSMTFCWLSAYALIISRMRRMLSAGVQRLVEALTGALLIALGVRVAAPLEAR
jgi:threonine/homoserine/homoserine lactone efflux protein